MPYDYHECSKCHYEGPGRAMSGGVCPECTWHSTPLRGYFRDTHERNLKTWSKNKQRSTKWIREEQARKKREAEQRAMVPVARYQPTCIKCGSAGCHGECGHEKSHRHLELQVRELNHALKRNQPVDQSTAQNSALGWTFRPCPFNPEDRSCLCLVPQFGANDSLNPAALQAGVEPQRIESLEPLFKTLSKYNPSLALNAMLISKNLLLLLHRGAVSHSHEDKAKVSALKRLLSCSTDVGVEGSEQAIKAARNALVLFSHHSKSPGTQQAANVSATPQMLACWNEQVRDKAEIWCPVAETMGDDLFCVVGDILNYLQAGRYIDKATEGAGWSPVDTKQAVDLLSVLYDKLLIARMLPCLQRCIGSESELLNMMAQHAYSQASSQTPGSDLMRWMRSLGLGWRNFNRICVLAHMKKLKMLVDKKPGQRLLSGQYNDLYTELTKHIESTVADYAPFLRSQDNTQSLGGATLHPTLGGAMGKWDLLANVEATLNLSYSPNSSNGGGSSLNYVTFLWDRDSISRSTVATGTNANGQAIERGAHTGSSGFLTSSQLVTQCKLVSSLAQIGRWITSDEERRLLAQQSTTDKALMVVAGVGNAYQATAGMIGNLAGASKYTSNCLGIGGVSVGLLNNLISTIQEGRTLYKMKGANDGVNKRIRSLHSLTTQSEGQALPCASSVDANAVKQMGATQAFKQSYGRQAASCLSSVWGLGSSIFTLSVAIESAGSAGLSAALLAGGTMGAAIPVVGWCLVGVAIIMGLALFAYDQHKASQAMTKVRNYGLLVDANTDDDVKLAEACALLYSAAFLDPSQIVDPQAAKVVIGLQALNWALFKDLVVQSSGVAPTVAREWELANGYAKSAGPEGLYNTWKKIQNP